jgi:hypothetical protein
VNFGKNQQEKTHEFLSFSFQFSDFDKEFSIFRNKSAQRENFPLFAFVGLAKPSVEKERNSIDGNGQDVNFRFFRHFILFATLQGIKLFHGMWKYFHQQIGGTIEWNYKFIAAIAFVVNLKIYFSQTPTMARKW